MTTTNNTSVQKNVTNVRLFVLFVLLMLSSTGVYSQNVETKVATSTEVLVSNNNNTVVFTENTVASATMDFAIWFVGGQKTSNDSNTSSLSKKSLINSGVKTNNVLIRTILKKVNVQGTSIV